MARIIGAAFIKFGLAPTTIKALIFLIEIKTLRLTLELRSFHLVNLNDRAEAWDVPKDASGVLDVIEKIVF